MTLHRDIYWLGKHWAVTGYGIQAVNKRYNKRFDIEASRIWEEGLAEPLRTLYWFNAEDFEEALAVARRRLQQAPVIFQGTEAEK